MSLKPVSSRQINPNYRLRALCFLFLLLGAKAQAQAPSRVSARMDASRITVGDQARLFIDVQHNPANGRLQWAVIPDTFNTLEVVERGKIDTIKQGDNFTYKQRIVLTGFDSGLYKIPAFVFSVLPNNNDTAYTVQSDSFALLVETVPVDTTKGFKGIKGIMYVNSTWKDYIWQIGGGLALIAITVLAVVFYMRRKKKPVPPPVGKQETLQERMLRQLAEVEAKQLWQKGQVKIYYVELTDIVRSYIEQRFNTPAMELTTDELLDKARLNKELIPYTDLLSVILHTADLAKFAKAEPLPQEHVDAMDKAIQFVNTSKPAMPVPMPGASEQSSGTPTDNTI